MGPGAMNAQVSIQQAKESQLMQQMKVAGSDTDQDAKIQKGAKQFEAMLLSTWLQQAEQSFASVPGADDDPDEQAKAQMMSLGVQSLSESLAASGGIGIGAMIAKAMEAAAKKANTGSATETAPVQLDEIPVRNLSIPLNSGEQSADSVADALKGPK
jgi:Rod binding domain-containing protein